MTLAARVDAAILNANKPSVGAGRRGNRRRTLLHPVCPSLSDSEDDAVVPPPRACMVTKGLHNAVMPPPCAQLADTDRDSEDDELVCLKSNYL